MRCREAIYVDESTIDFPIFLLFLNTKFPIFPISESRVSYFPIFLSDQAAEHPAYICEFHCQSFQFHLTVKVQGATTRCPNFSRKFNLGFSCGTDGIATVTSDEKFTSGER